MGVRETRARKSRSFLLALSAAMVAGLCCLVPASSRAQTAGIWPDLHLRGVPRRVDPHFDLRDTVLSAYVNRDNVVSLVWDRDSTAEARADFGGYAVYRSIGPDTTHMTLLRRYVLRPARLFGDTFINPDNGSTSRFWTFIDRPSSNPNHPGGARPYVGMFEDPDSILAFDRGPKEIGVDPGGVAIVDTEFTRIFLAGPKDGFDYFYSVTYIDTTENGEDLTPRSAALVGPLRPTGAPVANNLDVVKVVPNPYRFRADWDLPGKRKIQFTNLPERLTIRIYTTTGALVRELEHQGAQNNREDWDLKNGSGEEINSGIFLFRLTAPDGRERVGRFTVIR